MCIAAGIGGILSAVVGMASAVVQHGAAQQDYEMKAAQWKQNVVNSWAAARDEQGQLLLRQMEEERGTAQKIKLSDIEEAEKRAEVEVSAAAGNVSGISVQNLVADVTRRAAYNRTVERQNWIMTAAQLQKEQDATITRAEGRINSVTRPVAPSGAALAVNVAAAGVKMFGAT